MAGLENSVLVTKNVNFDYTSNPPHDGIITADGQLLIGSVTTTPNVSLSAGEITSPNGTIDINYVYPNLEIDLAGGQTAIDSITPNSGTSPIVPDSNGNINLVGSGSITNVGSLNTGTIQLTGLTQYNVLTGDGNDTINKVAPSATSGVPLISQGTSSQPAFGTAVVAGGGTGLTTTTAYGLIAGGTTATGNFQNTGTGAAASTVLIGNGASALPSFSATPQLTGLGIGAASTGSGLTFDGSNTMSAYAISTWTPTILGASAAGITTYTLQAGEYIKIGRLVVCSFDVAATSVTGTGNLLIGGLPFTSLTAASNIVGHGTLVQITAFTWPASTTMITLLVQSNATTASMLGSGSGIGFANVQMANVAQRWSGTITYYSAT